MVKWPPLVGTRTGGGGWMVTASLTIPLSLIDIQILTETREPLVRWIHDKDIFQVITSFIGLRCGIHCGRVTKPHLCGTFAIKRWQSMLILHWHAFPNNVLFAYQTSTNPLSTNYGILSKQREHGDGPPLLCMIFLGLELSSTIALTGSKPC